MFIYQCKMIKLFLVIFRKDKRIFKHVFNPVFCSRLHQSTSLLTMSTWLKSVDLVGRPTCTELCTFGRLWTVDRQGRPGQRAELSVCLGRLGRSTDSCQRAEFDRWTVDRTGRPAVYFWHFLLPTAIFFWGL